jgi:hypothetical protein
MTIRQRSETETRAQGFDAKIEAAFDWLSARSRYVFGVLGTLLVAGAAVAGLYELNKNRQDAAELALAQVEYGFSVAMGSPIDEFLVPEPFNEDQARRAREEALAHFEAVVLDHRRSRAAQVASVRAAEMEVDLGRWSDAEARLGKLVGQLSRRDALRAVALRLLGFGASRRPASPTRMPQVCRPIQPAHLSGWLRAEALRAPGPRSVRWLLISRS